MLAAIGAPGGIGFRTGLERPDLKRNATARVSRNGVVIGEPSIETLRRFKDDVTEVRDGFECGIGLGKFNDIQVGDIIETFEMVEIPRN